MSFKTLILRAAGTNCDGESEHAFRAAGAEVDLVHVNQLAASPKRLFEYDCLFIPGGFTYGDDVASAAVLAHRLECRLLEPIQAFVDRSRFVLGICNGFQALVRLGLFDDDSGEAALGRNASGRFEARWVRLRASTHAAPWFEPGREYAIPVAHAEGRFRWYPRDGEGEFPENRICVRYLGEGERAEYPANPNGSDRDIAGAISGRGHVMGMMPHPERFTHPTHHPYWTRFRGDDGSPPEEADLPTPLGLDLFRNIVRSQT